MTQEQAPQDQAPQERARPGERARPRGRARRRSRARPRERRLLTPPYLVVLGGVLGGLLWVWLSKTHVKGGILVIASSLLLASGVRLVLTDERAGLLASRRRGIDVAAFAVLGVALLVSALLLKNPS